MGTIKTIDMRPHPNLIRAALAHSDIPLTYNDDHTVSIPSGPGWDSNGNMTIPEGHVLIGILSGLLTLAMTKHMEDTMILPSNVSKIRQVAGALADMREFAALDEEDTEILREQIESLRSIADNLDPEKTR